MLLRKAALFLLIFSVFAPILLYTERIGFDARSQTSYFHEIPSAESLDTLKEPIDFISLDSNVNSLSSFGGVDSEISSKNTDLDARPTGKDLLRGRTERHKSRVLAETSNDEKELEMENVIMQAAESGIEAEVNDGLKRDELVIRKESEHMKEIENKHELPAQMEGSKSEQQIFTKKARNGFQSQMRIAVERTDAYVRHFKDQLIRSKVYLALGCIRSDPIIVRELRLRMREVHRALGDATKDSDLPRNAVEKLKAMELTLERARKIQHDCAVVVKKLRAMLHSAEEQLRVHKKQALFLTQLAAKTLPKGLNCLSLRLSTEYYSLPSGQRQFPNQEKLENPALYHYALFSDNIMAAAVVVNSTVFHAKDPSMHVFHIVTDRLNYAAMKMWFLANPPGKATIQIQSIEDFTWLNSSYSPVLKQLRTPSMINYYFRTHKANPDSNMKYRNPKYLSILNHLRFYLPEIFPKLDKVVFLDDDIVTQRDLSSLWMLDLRGKVIGAVETCRESFHRFDKYLNFSNPIISKNFDPHACGWAFGMNVFDLTEWRRQKITELYHNWQKLNHDRLLWKLGTLPPGLITFWNRTFPLDRSWHALGLGYNPSINHKEIERAAVIHYNGNLKPWLEIGIPKYRHYWAKFINPNQEFLRDCNINP